jgi:hypothetical protein
VIAARVLGWAIVYAAVVAGAAIVARGGVPFVYQGF